jgi:fermentation-respiration switch protein FrsA (DUF1100 family)
VLVVALSGIGCNLQRSILFPRSMLVPDEHEADSVDGLERLWLAVDDYEVEAWLLPPTRATGTDATGVVIFAHGNGELIDYWPRMLGGIPEMGLALLLVEYPGYGRSGGTPSEGSIRKTMLAAYDAMAARPDIDRKRIVLHGRSLGGGAVGTLLGQRPVAALILQSTFTSVTDLAWRLFKVPSFLVRDPFPTLEAVREFTGPVLVIHGRVDELVSHENGVLLAEAAPNGRLVSLDCGHNDCPRDWPQYWRVLHEFLNATGVLDPRGSS